MRLKTNLAGQDVSVLVEEVEPTSRIAWSGGPHEGLQAYHAWIITPTHPGVHLWAEETMQGLIGIKAAKQDPAIFWKTHKKLLADLARVALEREAAGQPGGRS